MVKEIRITLRRLKIFSICVQIKALHNLISRLSDKSQTKINQVGSWRDLYRFVRFDQVSWTFAE